MELIIAGVTGLERILSEADNLIWLWCRILKTLRSMENIYSEVGGASLQFNTLVNSQKKKNY